MTSVPSVSQFLSRWLWQLSNIKGNKKEIKFCIFTFENDAEQRAKSSNVYRCYHGDISKMSQARCKINIFKNYEADLAIHLVFNEAWVQNVYFFLLDSLFMRKTTKAALMIKGF